MSISSRITSIEEHIGDIYDTLELGGADLTNTDKNLVNVKPILKQKYLDYMNNGTREIWNNWEKVTGTGKQVTLNNTVNAPMDLTVKGDTSQDGTPTPTNEVSINNVTGDVEVLVQNKNINDGIDDKFYITSDGLTYKTSQNDTGLCIPVKGGNVTISTTETQARYRIACANSEPSSTGQNCSNGVNKDNTSDTVTINTTGYKYLLVNCSNISAIQIEYGTTATTYTPHQEQTFTLNLGTTELCKIGNYQDYFYKDNGKWYLHKEIGKAVLDGDETFSTNSAWNRTNTNCYIYNLGVTNTNILSNYFNYNSNAYGNDISGSMGIVWTDQLLLRIDNTIASDVTGFKTWLSTHNTEVYYILATPTNTEITDTTMITQLEAINTAKSYMEQTNISGTSDELNPILMVVALKNI